MTDAETGPHLPLTPAGGLAPPTNAVAVTRGGDESDSSVAAGRRRIEIRLHIYFALTVCLSGLTLVGDPDTELLPVIACFFALFGLVFVDLLRWFVLPASVAYIALGLIALYCIGRFVDEGWASDRQMLIVAELLVLVQAVLMLQKKNRRIYEQLAIFCLLELIVAATFNDALIYGLFLFPLALLGAAALSLLHSFESVESFHGRPDEVAVDAADAVAAETKPDVGERIQTWTPQSAESFSRAARALPRTAWFVLSPAVILIAALFFYGLPRTHEAVRGAGGGRTLVGFSDTIRLAQIGRMLQSDATAARIELSHRQTGEDYKVSHGLYVRGAVLETYGSDRATEGTWLAADNNASPETNRLPRPPPRSPGQMPERVGRYDDVRVRVTVEQTLGDALFAFAPYYDLATDSGVLHQRERWILKRRPPTGLVRSPVRPYQFGTVAFADGRQSRFLPRRSVASIAEEVLDQGDGGTDDELQREKASAYRRWEEERYVRRCLEYDEYRIPSAGRNGETVAESLPPDGNDPFKLASAIENYLTHQGRYQYTLDLPREKMPGLDPLEQFLTVDRRGNCQHFASAMVLMLRSQRIPARLVVGFSTDEFNNLGGYYVARQLHAHAWVEALIDAQWLPAEELPYPIEAVDQYWVRFDPTPGGGGVEHRVSPFLEAFEMAQGLWSDYVVQRSAASDRSVTAGGGSEVMTTQYRTLFHRIEMLIAQIRTGRLSGGAFSLGKQFSWPLAFGAVALMLFGLTLYRLGPRSVFMPRWRSGRGVSVPRPQVAFFAETLELLRRVGFERKRGQTPLELVEEASRGMSVPGGESLDQPLRLLTRAFYDTRFGRDTNGLETPEPSPAVREALARVRQGVEALRAGGNRRDDR